jgi:DNA-binding NarL/FixJ family response regulator
VAERIHTQPDAPKPDLIVVDITMPLLNGIDAAVQIKKSLPGMRLLFVTMHASTAYVNAAFEAGGTGYVLKSGPRDELPDAVQSVLAGRVYVSHGLSTEHIEQFQHPAATTSRLSKRTVKKIALVMNPSIKGLNRYVRGPAPTDPQI